MFMKISAPTINIQAIPDKFRSTQLSWICAIVAVNNIIYFTPNLSLGYYIFWAVVLCFSLPKDKISFRLSGIVFWLACILSIIVNDVPTFFSPWLRLSTFVVITALIGPFVHSNHLWSFREKMFWIMRYLFMWVTLLSFFGMFFGFAKYHSLNGYFCGITSHSMLLGIIAANTVLFSLYKFFTSQTLKDTKPHTCPIDNILNSKIFWLLCMAISLLMVFRAGSRVAFIACVVGAVILCFLMNILHQKRTILLLFLFFAALILGHSVWTPHFEYLEKKNNGIVTAIDYSSRALAWKFHWDSFRNNPVAGVGFAAADLSDSSMSIDNESGHIESGNSWISICAMTGSIGIATFSIMFLQSIVDLLKQWREHKEQSYFLLALLVFYIIHMCAEGYIFAAGGIAFFNFWLLLGVIQAGSLSKVTQNEFSK